MLVIDWRIIKNVLPVMFNLAINVIQMLIFANNAGHNMDYSPILWLLTLVKNVKFLIAIFAIIINLFAIIVLLGMGNLLRSLINVNLVYCKTVLIVHQIFKVVSIATHLLDLIMQQRNVKAVINQHVCIVVGTTSSVINALKEKGLMIKDFVKIAIKLLV